MQETLPVRTAKTALRYQARKRRAAIDDGARAEAAEGLARQGLGFLGRHETVTISGYYPVRDELDCLPLLRRLEGEGASIALPIIIRKPVDLRFRAWRTDLPAAAGEFGIPVPPESMADVRPDIVLTPLLAFDRRGYRLGNGGGYYDAALARLASDGPVTAVGLAFGCLEVEAVPHDETDYRLDWILTPSGPIKPGR
jgi:5-formyltetrahydrofolate cyclo-ligase